MCPVFTGMTKQGIRLNLTSLYIMLNSNGFFFQIVTFVPMKNKITIVSLSFSIMVMAAILLQSLHSFHHLEKFLSEKHCHHKYASNKTQISHCHNDFDHCFVCEFALSNYTNTSFFSFDFKKPDVHASYSVSYSKAITQYFKGSLFALRAPPCFIV